MNEQKRHALEALTDAEIDAMGAGEFPAVTDDDLRQAVAVSASGRAKVPISIRVDEEVLEFFRAQGARYQTRINEVLLRYARGELVPAGQVRVTRAARTPRARLPLAARAAGGSPGTQGH
jgi:uncharacterized protein (DUF4415 family)